MEWKEFIMNMLSEDKVQQIVLLAKSKNHRRDFKYNDWYLFLKLENRMSCTLFKTVNNTDYR